MGQEASVAVVGGYKLSKWYKMCFKDLEGTPSPNFKSLWSLPQDFVEIVHTDSFVY